MRILLIHIICCWLTCISLNFQAQDINDSLPMAYDDTMAVTDSEEEAEEVSSKPDSNELRTISQSTWDSLRKDKAFNYQREKKEEEIKKTKKNDPPPFSGIGNWLNASFFKFLMFVMVGIILILVIRHLFQDGDYSFWSKRKKKEVDEETSFENVAAFSAWDQALRNALTQQNYRLAIRVLYLETLQKLDQKGMIVLGQEKTNWDYVMQLSSTQHGTSFTLLTKYFDYIWYGSFTVDQENYKALENSFRNFQQDLS